MFLFKRKVFLQNILKLSQISFTMQQVSLQMFGTKHLAVFVKETPYEIFSPSKLQDTKIKGLQMSLLIGVTER